MILSGAMPAALLAVFLDNLLAWVQRLSVRQLHIRVWLSLWLFLLGLIGWMWLSSLHSSLRGGFAPEFMVMSEGYPGLKKTYDLELNTVVLQSGLMYDALHVEAVDVISGFSTDGRIREYGLFTLKDDLSHFPSYDAGITIRQEITDKYPELLSVLQLLSGKFTDDSMIQLNYRVDVLKESPAKVAESYLDSLGLLKKSTQSPVASIRIGSKIFTEQYILAEMIARLIEGHTNLQTEVKTGMGGTQICFEALAAGAIDLYPEYSGTGLEVILGQKNLLPDSVTKNPDNLYSYVNKEYKKNYNIRWLPPLGFNNTYALLMRREQAKELQITSISDLKQYIENQ
jgi:osmoprotectant transport system permease protein